MSDNYIDEQDILNPVDGNKDVADDVGTSDDDVADEENVDYKALLEESERKRKQLYARLKRVEKKSAVPEVPTSTDSQMSQKDLIALVRADIHEDDIETVEKFARLEGVSIAEALKSDDLSAILNVRKQKRQSAKVANTKSVPTGASKVSDDVILSNASKGDLPDDPSVLVAARRNRKTKRI